MKLFVSPILLALAACVAPVWGAEPVRQFTFSASAPTSPAVAVTAQTIYDREKGYGFLEGTAPATEAPVAPAIFAVDVPEGNYEVTMRFGDPARATSTTIKAESRRLMVERVDTAPGQTETRTFTVNVRRPEISTGGVTLIDDREKGPPPVPDWDERLTLEFNGAQPGVAALEIKPVTSAVTVFLVGDSTVTNQAYEPYAGWGQMLPRFFGPGVAISNQAQSGQSLPSFQHQRRLTKVLSMVKQGDYVFIQFGHNDQKSKSAGAGPFTTYQANLRRYVTEIRAQGGWPVLVTPMERRRWVGEEQGSTLDEYAAAVRLVGAEEKVPVIDLHAMSLKLYAALGAEKSKLAFVHYPARTFPGQEKVLQDDTHHSVYGGYELARCMVEGIKAQVPALAASLRPEVERFDPSHPDPVEQVAIPRSRLRTATEKPAGS